MKLNDSGFAIFITAVFALLTLYGVSFHEIWRDELQAWQIALASHSIPELFENCRYEGHPMLWHLMVFVVQLFTLKVVYMQYLHVFISIVTVWLMVRYSPLSRIQKWLLPFGYTLLFEYTLISRCYNTGFLLMVLFLVLHQRQQTLTVLKVLVLGLMANTSVYGLALSCSLFAFNILLLFNHKENFRPWIWNMALWCVLVLLSVWQIKPEPDNSYQTGVDSFIQFNYLKASLLKVGDAYTNLYNFNVFPLWDLQFNFNYSPTASWVWFVFTLFCIGAFCYAFRHNKSVLFFYLAATIGFFLLNILAERFPPRQTAHYLLVLLAAFWLMAKVIQERYKWVSTLFTLLLAAQVITGMAYYVTDQRKPFSNGIRAATFIQQYQLNHLPVTGVNEFTLAPFAAYLNKEVYFVERQEAGTFIRWDNKRYFPIDAEHINQSIEKISKDKRQVLFVVNQSYKQTIDELIGTKQILAKEIASFQGAMVYDEDYYLYLALPVKH